MISRFLSDLQADFDVLPEEVTVLSAVDIGSFEDLHSLMQEFPSIAKLVRRPLLSNIALAKVSGLAMARPNPQRSQTPGTAGYGAEHPSQARWAIGAQVPIPTAATAASGGSSPPVPSAIDLRPAKQGWTVRDQGYRGTCVAFASVACAESCARGRVSPHYSAQYCYWDIKVNRDPTTTVDGTTLRCACDSLAAAGVCDEIQWPYDPTPIPGNVAHTGGVNPTSAAHAVAASRCTRSPNHQVFAGPSGGAGAVLSLLKQGRLVG